MKYDIDKGANKTFFIHRIDTVALKGRGVNIYYLAIAT